MTETCGSCRHYMKDEIGAYSLGDCAEKVQRDSITIVHHKGKVFGQHQELLLYPGQSACGKWQEKLSIDTGYPVSSG